MTLGKLLELITKIRAEMPGTTGDDLEIVIGENPSVEAPLGEIKKIETYDEGEVYVLLETED